jgi:heme o synthase
VRGIRSAKLQSAVYTGALWAVSLLLVPYGLAGSIYLTTAVVLGAYFFWMALRGFEADDSKVWAKKFFVASLIYLTALFAALIIDAI